MTERNLINSRWLALACALFLLFVLTACGGGGGGSPPPPAAPAPIDPGCDSVSVFENGACRVFGRRIDTRASTPFTENGAAVTLEVVLFKPLADGRYPTLVFHHGSTGNGSDPSLFTETFTSKAIASWFVDRGWIVAFPQRRGRGQSDGLYDEGFTPNRSGYSCEADLSLAGADRALADIEAATDWLRGRADVDTTRMLIGGTSRGGILSIAFMPRQPDVYLGALNFVGGWIGEGCGDFRQINRELFVRGATWAGRTLWLYAENDPFYSIAHSRDNHDAYTTAGGLGDFELLQRDPGLNGHFVINDPALWGPAVEAYVDAL